MSPDVSRLATQGARVDAHANDFFETGLMAGTTVLTRDGELPVEYLGLGDHLITRDAGYATITAYEAERLDLRMVRVTAGSLGHTRPDADLLVPWSQRILVRDWRARTLYGQNSALIPAHRLIDGEFVTDAGLRDVTVFRLSCDAPHVMYAGGLEVATGLRTAAMA